MMISKCFGPSRSSCRCPCCLPRLVEEAPGDGRTYGRRNCRWVPLKDGSGVFVQADWDQEEPSEPDYVKNRPRINEVVLVGNRELPEIAITNMEIDEMLRNQI